MKSMLRLQQRILHVHRHFRFPSHLAPGNRKLVIFDIGNVIFISPIPPQAEFVRESRDCYLSAGIQHMWGTHGRAQDLEKAFHYYKLAADQGDPEALHQTALMKIEGKGGYNF